jgi:hypothetical protein
MKVGRSQLLMLGVLFSTGSALASDSSYAVKVDVAPVKRGEKMVAKIRITPGVGFHVNKDYPAQVAVFAPQGISVEKPKQTAKDAIKLEESGAEFDVALTCAEAGHKTVTGDIKFAVCSASTCDPKKEKLSFSFDVK